MMRIHGRMWDFGMAIVDWNYRLAGRKHVLATHFALFQLNIHVGENVTENMFFIIFPPIVGNHARTISSWRRHHWTWSANRHNCPRAKWWRKGLRACDMIENIHGKAGRNRQAWINVNFVVFRCLYVVSIFSNWVVLIEMRKCICFLHWLSGKSCEGIPTSKTNFYM